MQDDESLMEAVRRRDSSAFEMLFDAYNRLVYGIALRMLGEKLAAEDVTQAIFLKIWHSPDLFRGGNFRAWLIRVARNSCLDELRSRKHNTPLEPSMDVVDDASLEETAFANLDAHEVRSALEVLSKEQREAIELGFFSGLTHCEIADRLALPLGTVKARIRSGLQRLRGALQEVVNR